MKHAPRFTDRLHAGRELADVLRERDTIADVVLAIPRGGLPLGRVIADALDAPLDVIVAKKIGAPGNAEYAIGAVASDGSVWKNEEAIRLSGANERYFQEQRSREATNARQKAEQYRQGRTESVLTGRRVVIVDDGVATGSTLRACLMMITQSQPESVIVAVPVGPPETIAELAQITDEVVCLSTPHRFAGVGQFYDTFAQVSDAEAIEYLQERSP